MGGSRFIIREGISLYWRLARVGGCSFSVSSLAVSSHPPAIHTLAGSSVMVAGA